MTRHIAPFLPVDCDTFTLKCPHCKKIDYPYVDIYANTDGKRIMDYFCVKCGRIIRRVEVR